MTESEELSSIVSFRPMKKEDESFIYHSALNAVCREPYAIGLFISTGKMLTNAIVNGQCVVTELEGVILGYAIRYRKCLVYSHVKRQYRDAGLFTKMVKHLGLRCDLLSVVLPTAFWCSIWKHPFSWDYETFSSLAGVEIE